MNGKKVFVALLFFSSTGLFASGGSVSCDSSSGLSTLAALVVSTGILLANPQRYKETGNKIRPHGPAYLTVSQELQRVMNATRDQSCQAGKSLLPVPSRTPLEKNFADLGCSGDRAASPDPLGKLLSERPDKRAAERERLLNATWDLTAGQQRPLKNVLGEESDSLSDGGEKQRVREKRVRRKRVREKRVLAPATQLPGQLLLVGLPDSDGEL
jgi:hypothetical protein